MTEIAMRADQGSVETYSTDQMDRLARWLQQADAIFAIAERICDTSFVPTAYRKRPAEAAAAMLAGAELGFDPMASLRAFDSINGTPAPKAITLRAVVLGKGHEVETIEQSATRAVVRGRRFGKGEWQVSTWDLDRARRLPQFKTNANYSNNPEAMLVARATAEVCRWIASDAIMGMPYAAEEIDDQPALAPSPVTRRLTVADLDADPEPPAITAPAATFTEQREAHEASHPDMVTAEQKRQMFALFRDLGYVGDENRAARLQATAKALDVPEVASFNDLSHEQANVVIAKLRERKERQAAAAGGDQ